MLIILYYIIDFRTKVKLSEIIYAFLSSDDGNMYIILYNLVTITNAAEWISWQQKKTRKFVTFQDTTYKSEM